uniref:C-type lectin domain-containing protein n=1 Tax=Panagrolaimus davidi TaxID=227884 RepID=A0A914PIL6_9BILA
MIPGNWSWTDNTNFDFKEWAPGEPQNLTQSCGTITILNGYWASDDCFKTKPYVCEVPNIVLTTTAPTVYPVYMNCSMGWTYFEPTHSCYGHDWYGVVTSNWTTAEKYRETQTQKAHLVSIHSYDEMKFVSSLISFSSYYSWSGLYSVDDEKTWKWSDGSPVDYLPWQSGYPNRNVSSCAAVWVEMFADHPCDLIMATLCKRPAFT